MNPKVNDQSIELEAKQEKLQTAPVSHSPQLWFSKRFFIAVLLAVCHLNSAFSRFNISIALVEMTYSKQIKNGNLTETQPPEFDWDSSTKGLTLSIFYYGGLVSFLGSYFVSKIGGANCCALTMLLSGIITLFHPISLQYNFYSFLVCRFIVGFSESLLVVSIMEVSSQWTPKNERSQLISISTSGVNVGLAIVHGVCAFVAFKWGWRMIFYVTGIISLITSSVCYILIKNRPSDDKHISKQELIYIQERIATAPQNKVRHPYMKIILSEAVWALLVIKFTVVIGMTFIATFLPMYVKDITHKDINEVGIISSMPNILNIFMLPVWGMLLDYGKSIDISVTRMHKIIIGGSFTLIGVLFVSVALISNFMLSITSFLLIQTFLFLIGLVSQIISISIAPNSSSIIVGLCSALVALGCIVTRSITASMTTHKTLEEWNSCFLIIGGVSLLGGALFTVCGSSEAQPWSFITSNTGQDDRENQTNKKSTN